MGRERRRLLQFAYNVMTLRGAFFTMLIKCKSFFIAIAILIRLLLSPPSGPRSPRSYFSFLLSFVFFLHIPFTSLSPLASKRISNGGRNPRRATR